MTSWIRRRKVVLSMLTPKDHHQRILFLSQRSHCNYTRCYVRNLQLINYRWEYVTSFLTQSWNFGSRCKGNVKSSLSLLSSYSYSDYFSLLHSMCPIITWWLGLASFATQVLPLSSSAKCWWSWESQYQTQKTTLPTCDPEMSIFFNVWMHGHKIPPRVQ